MASKREVWVWESSDGVPLQSALYRRRLPGAAQLATQGQGSKVTRYIPEQQWVPVGELKPVYQTHAWIVWKGKVQPAPYLYCDTARGGAWFFEGSRAPHDEVSHYMPLAPPQPPKVPEDA